MTSRILLAKMNILSVIRASVMTCILQPMLDDQDAKDQSSTGGDYQELFLHLHTGFLSESSFYQDYSARYPLNEDLEIFKQSGVIIDAMRIEYLRDGLETIQPVPNKPTGEFDPMELACLIANVVLSFSCWNFGYSC